jgi:hypothetical protein
LLTGWMGSGRSKIAQKAMKTLKHCLGDNSIIKSQGKRKQMSERCW